MSASLVGSEMCIRDSMVLICNAAATRRVAIPPPRACAAHDPVADDFVAVSYTHLTLPTICSV
eukprot:11810488-Alexandrium_andersonii.AAC.1